MDATRRMLATLTENFPDITLLPPLEARAVVDARVRPATNLDDVARTEDHDIEVDGGTIGVRVYIPHQLDPRMPATTYVHGGGFLHGSIASHDGFCRRWARATSAVVVSVAHRLAPDVAPPVPAHDVIAALDWAAAHEWSSAGVILAGDSSGANLAAVAALAVSLRGSSPVRAQVLLYPILDPGMDSDSQRRLGEGNFLRTAAIDYYWDTYLGAQRHTLATDWWVSPGHADDHSRVAPAIIVTGGLDPLLDEGRAYVRTLRDAGVPVLHRHYAGEFHGFLTIPDFPPAEAARSVLWHDIISTVTKEHTP